MHRRFTLLILLLWSFNAFSGRSTDLSLLNICETNKDLFSLRVDCNDLFHHYIGHLKRRSTGGKVRMAAYNAFRMGTPDSKFKDLELTSKMIDENWDIVALSELQAMSADRLGWNINFKRVADAPIEAYQKPVYLKLLFALRARDASWSLILSPVGQGSTVEFYGFLYRRGMVLPKPSNYCRNKLEKMKTVKFDRAIDLQSESGYSSVEREVIAPQEALACGLDYRESVEKNVERVPLLARFKAGSFDFHYLTIHTRFRSPCESIRVSDTDEMKVCVDQNVQPMLKDFKDVTVPRMTKSAMREITRFYEVKNALRESQKVNGKVILGGDFNLEYEIETNQINRNLRRAFWKSALSVSPGSQVFVSEKTSLGRSRRYSSSYDHFIFNPNSVLECDGQSARRFDFFKDLDLKTYLEEKTGARGRRVYSRLLEMAEAEFAQRLVVDPRDQVVSMRDYSYLPPSYKCNGVVKKGSYLEAYLGQYECRVLNSDPDFLEKLPTRTYVALLSDHVPIAMSCSTH